MLKIMTTIFFKLRVVNKNNLNNLKLKTNRDHHSGFFFSSQHSGKITLS